MVNEFGWCKTRVLKKPTLSEIWVYYTQIFLNFSEKIMADDLKVKVQLEATMDKNQVQKEVTEVADTAQQILDKQDLKIDLMINRANLEKELEDAKVRLKRFKIEGDEEMELLARLDIQDLESKIKKTKDNIKQVDEDLEELNNQNLDWVSNEIKQIWDEAEKADKKLSWWSGKTWLLWWLKKFIGWSAIVAWVTKISKSVLELWNNAQQAQISFTTMLWDADKAKSLLQDLSNFARKTPFELQWIRESATQLLAMWVQAEDMIDTLKALWDVSAGLNVPLERLALNYGQVLTQWKLTWKELKDFTTAWVPLLDELSKKLWKTKTEIQDMVSAGQISSQMMVEAFRSMTSEWWKFANLMEQQSETLAGRWSNLKDWLASIWETIWLEVIPTISELVWKVADWIEDTWKSIATLASQTVWNISTAVSRIFGVLSDLWDAFSDLFFWIKSDWSSSAVTFWQIFAAVLQKIWQWIEAVSLMVTELWDLMRTWTSNVKNWLWWIKTWYDAFANDFFVKWKSWTESYGNAMKAFWTYNVKEVKSVENTLKWLSDDWEEFGAKVIQQENALAESFVKTWNYLKNNPLTKWVGGGDWWLFGDVLLWWSGSWWWGKSKAEDMLKAFWDEATDLWNDIWNEIDKHQKEYDKVVESIQKVRDSYEDFREKAKDTWRDAETALKKYNEELEKNQADAVTNLWQRYVELKKDLIDVDSYMKKVAEDMSRKEINTYQDRWYDEYRWYKLKDLIALKEKLDEMKLIEENTTEEQRQSEEFTKKTSKAQEILNKLNEKALELEEKKAKELEKQAIATAAQYNFDWQNNFRVWEDEQTKEMKARYLDREWVWQEIHDQDNIEYAKQLEDQILWLNNQLGEFKKEKDDEVEILVDATARKVQLEEEYTKVFQDSIKKQKDWLDELIRKTDTLIAKRREYLTMSASSVARAYGWDISNARVSLVGENWPEQIIARQASYVQPRNASNSYSTVNNNSSFSINWMSVNVNNMDEFLEDLKQRLTYRS